MMWANIFKFLVVNEGDWYGYWRNSVGEDYWLAGENGDGDVQFNPADAGLSDGNYTIDFNIFTKRVTLTPVS